MTKFTKALRQRIVEDFAKAHNGWFDAAQFFAHVEKAGPDHPAYGWFQWDRDKAWHEHNLDLARDFARGLVVKFEIQTGEPQKFTIAQRSAPFLVSPVSSRANGGGYYLNDPQDPEHIAELGRQAAQSLAWLMRRYAAPLAAVGADMDMLESLRAELADMKGEAAAEEAA
jgi:hypothetical protein